jgi:hypothetical protein
MVNITSSDFSSVGMQQKRRQRQIEEEALLAVEATQELAERTDAFDDKVWAVVQSIDAHDAALAELERAELEYQQVSAGVAGTPLPRRPNSSSFLRDPLEQLQRPPSI